MTPDERPDPLAEPVRAARRPGPPDPYPGRQPESCTQMISTEHGYCTERAVMTVWVGGTRCEHLGPYDFCQAHGDFVLQRQHMLSCGICGLLRNDAPAVIRKVETRADTPVTSASGVAQRALDSVFRHEGDHDHGIETAPDGAPEGTAPGHPG